MTLWIYDRLYLLINLVRANLLSFKQAREIQDYSGGSNTTVSCEVRGAEIATATNPEPNNIQLDILHSVWIFLFKPLPVGL